MVTAQGYLLLPERYDTGWNGDDLLEALTGWDAFAGAQYREAAGRGEERQMVVAAGDFTIVLSYKPSDTVAHRLTPLDLPQELANAPENVKRKLQFEHPLVPSAEHQATVYYEITYSPTPAEVGTGRYDAEQIRAYVAGVLRILLVLASQMEATSIARNAHLYHTKEDEGRFLLVSREALADSYHLFMAEKAIPLALFASYHIEDETAFHVQGTLQDLNPWWDEAVRFVNFPKVDRDLYRSLSRALYEAVAYREAGEPVVLYQWADRTVSYHPHYEGQGPAITWDCNELWHVVQ